MGATGSGLTSGISHLTSSIGTRVSVPNTTVLDASCCYIYTNPSGDIAGPYSTCTDVTFDISGLDISGKLITVGSITISSENINNDGAKIEICARSIGQSAQALGSQIRNIGSNLTGRISNIASEGKSMGGINGFVLLVISGLLSLFVYVLFMLGPFMFWTKFAPNTLIVGENECHKGRTILDRHFSHDRNQLPYYWQKYKDCKPPTKNRPIILDKCMNDINTEVLQDKIKVGGSSIFDKIDFLFRGFPYTLVDPNKEILFSCYKGGVALLATIVACIIIGWCVWGTSNINGGISLINLRGDINMLAPILINCFTSAAIIFCILIYLMKRGVKPATGSLTVTSVLVLLGTLGINMLPGGGGPARLIAACIAAIIIFMYVANLSDKQSEDGKNYSFTMAMVKAIYYIRKALVLEFQGLNIGGNTNFCNMFKYIGKLPIPGWIITIFGPAILPIMLLISFLWSLIGSIWGGFWGPFDWYEPKMSSFFKLSKCYKKNKDDDKKKMNGGSSELNVENDKNNSNINNNFKGGLFSMNDAKKLKEMKASTKEIASIAMSEAKKSFIDFKNRKYKEYQQRKELGGFQNFPMGLLVTFTLISAVFLVLSLAWYLPGVLLKYFLIPLLYPKIMVNIISCNIKSLIFVLISGILGIMWHPNNQNKYVPKEALIWMTVTFGIITLFNVLSK